MHRKHSVLDLPGIFFDEQRNFDNYFFVLMEVND